MPQTCSQCSRVNPMEAAFCYYDGRALNGRGDMAGPVNVATQDFSTPFVFPSGQVCRNFDQLALACHEHWPVFVDLVQEGYLEAFLKSLGRLDLARAAHEAAVHLDREQGLDDLLAALPSEVLQAPKLRVEPQEVNLGVLQLGEDHRFELVLENQGMRLLYGSITCVDGIWLALGDNPGVQQKLFQFRDGLSVPVHVRGQCLRGRQQPLEGRLVIVSNGGKFTIRVRLEVAVKPFPEGCLAGALTPRQVAEKAKASPREAAPLFEKGAVAGWYESNGWKYPVQGPSSSGMGAVQQFFEALGLVTPPQVDVSPQELKLRGRPGDELQSLLTVTAREKRPVFAHAASNCPWLQVGQVRLDGRSGTIPLTVPSVPDEAGATLHGQVRVTTNGNQHVVVAVRLKVGRRAPPVRRQGSAGLGTSRQAARAAVALPPAILDVVEPVELPPPLAPSRRPCRLRSWISNPRRTMPRTTTVEARRPGYTCSPFASWPSACSWSSSAMSSSRASRPARRPSGKNCSNPVPRIGVQFHDQPDRVTLGSVGVKPGPGQVVPRGSPLSGSRACASAWSCSRSRIRCTPAGTSASPSTRGAGPTTPASGWTGTNGCSANALSARPKGRWETGPAAGRSARPASKRPPAAESGTGSNPSGSTIRSKWRSRRRSRSCPVNRHACWTPAWCATGSKTRTAGRTGSACVFCSIPTSAPTTGCRSRSRGRKQLCDTLLEFRRTQEIPDFIQALEREDLQSPGTIAHVQLKLGGRLEPPDRVTLGAWPNPRLRTIDPRCSQEKTMWEVPVLPIKTLPPRRIPPWSFTGMKRCCSPGSPERWGSPMAWAPWPAARARASSA